MSEAPGAQRWGWARVTLIGISSAAALFLVVFLGYELALARVPEHRATLERLLRAQTGLDVRFSQLGVRWGWYGPEAVFRDVELGEPGRARVLLRAPELTVGFDAWRTMRSGHLEAGRISLVAPDIDLQRVGSERPPLAAGTAPVLAGGLEPPPDKRDTPAAARARLLERWRDGRIDIEGGILRLPDPAGSADPFLLQIRRVSARRSGDDWNLFALVFLPDRLGRTARVAMRLNGSLEEPESWSGSLRFEGRRLAFAGWQALGGIAPALARYIPVAGGGDLTLSVDFTRGQVNKAQGGVYAGGLVLASPIDSSSRTLELDRLSGQWWLSRHSSYWRLRVSELQLGNAQEGMTSPSQRAALAADVGEGWTRGKLEDAPLNSVAAIGQWLAPHLDLGGVDLGGTAREVTFDWNTRKAAGQRLKASAQLADISITPPSRGFVLAGMAARVSGNENELQVGIESDAARLELASAPRDPLEGVHVASRLRIARLAEGWQIATDRTELRHQAAKLELAGTLTGGATNLQPELVARGRLTAADVLWVQRALGAGATRALGSISASLTGGRVERAEFEMRGPVDQLPYGGESGSFAGALTLQDAVIASSDHWPEATGVHARVEWRGSLVRALVDSGEAGPFRLANATVEWRSSGEGGAHANGQVTGRMQDVIAWLQAHPGMDEYAPRLQSVGIEGNTRLDFNITVPEQGNAKARVVASLEDAQLRWASDAVPIENLAGSLTFEAGRLQRSMLTGTWLGGPVTLRIDEHRERDQTALTMRAQGRMSSQRLAELAAIDPHGRLTGSADWSGDLTFLPASASQPARWRVRADSTLVGVASELPEPLEKPADGPLPLHVDLSGGESIAQLRVSLSDRLRSVLAVERADTGWRVQRGAVTFGTEMPTLPAEPVVLIQGRVNRLDLPSYLALWQQARSDPRAPHFQAQLVAAEVVAAGRRYPEVTLVGERTDSGTQLQIDSESLGGVARWPLPGSPQPVELHLTHLSLSEPANPTGLAAVLAAIGSSARVSIDDLIWEGRRVGNVTAMLTADEDGLALDDVRVSGATHDGTGSLQCHVPLTGCRGVFTLESSDAAATLVDFGFRPDLSAARASLSGDIEWRPASEVAWPATLTGRLSLRLSDGTTQRSAGGPDQGRPFALFSVPELVAAMNPPQDGAERARELRFTELEADFQLADGQASTSDLHFDGDAEILMRGRTGLLDEDYDEEVWVLKGEDRLPAAVRRFSPTPRMATAWLTLRGLFAATGEARPRAMLRLRGTWDDPVVSEAE